MLPIGRVSIALIIGLAVVAPGRAHAEQPELDGVVANRSGWRIAGESESSLLQTTLEIGFKQRWDEWSVRALGRSRYESRLGPEPVQDNSWRELTVRYTGESLGITAGRQQVVWGKTDGLRLLDSINPLDLREFILDDYLESRIPLNMLNVEWFGRAGSLQVLLVPEHGRNRHAEPGSEFFFAPLPPSGLPVTLVPARGPEESLADLEGGLRWSGQVGRWEYTLNAYSGWTQDPVAYRTLQPLPAPHIVIMPVVERRRLVGGSVDRPIGPVVVRFEGSYTPDEYLDVATPDGVGNYVSFRVLRYAVGLDWIRNNWLISPQMFQQHVLDAGNRLVADANQSFFTLLLQRKWLQDRLTFRLFTLYGPDRSDRWIAPRLVYEIGGTVELGISADLFGGQPDGQFGKFRDRDRVVVSARWKF